MKKREGFVSNSSSASFILKFRSTKKKKNINKDIVAASTWHGFIAKKTGLEGKKDEYSLTVETTMFNDWYDIVFWPFIRMICEGENKDYQLVSLIQTEEEWSSCNKKVLFNPICWEMDDIKYYDNRGYGEEVSDKARESAKATQKEYNNFYKQYLEYIEDNTKSLSNIEFSHNYFEDKYGG